MTTQLAAVTVTFLFFVKTTTRCVSGHLGMIRQETCFFICAQAFDAPRAPRHERTVEFHHAHRFAKKRDALKMCCAIQAKTAALTGSYLEASPHWVATQVPSLAERWTMMAEERARLEDDMMAMAPTPTIALTILPAEEEDPPWLQELAAQAKAA